MVFPKLKGLYIRIKLDSDPIPTMDHVLSLEQYSKHAEINFDYEIDCAWNPYDCKSLIRQSSTLLTPSSL